MGLRLRAMMKREFATPYGFLVLHDEHEAATDVAKVACAFETLDGTGKLNPARQQFDGLGLIDSEQLSHLHG